MKRGYLAGALGAALAVALLSFAPLHAQAIRTGGGLSIGAAAAMTFCAAAGCTLTYAPTADGATTDSALRIIWTTPADTTGTNAHRALRISPTIGNATAGTNTAYALAVDAFTGDAQVTTHAIDIGAMTGTAASEVAMVIGAGWDQIIDTPDTSCAAVALGPSATTGFASSSTSVFLCQGGNPVMTVTSTVTSMSAATTFKPRHIGSADTAMGVVTGGTCTNETVVGTSTVGALTADCTAGQTLIATFGTAFAAAPDCLISAADADAAVSANFVSASDTTTFTITAVTGAGTPQVIKYFCVQPS